MRILNVNMSLDPADGGTAERTFQLSRNLASLGCSVTTLCLDKGLTDQRRRACGGPVIALRTLNRRFYFPHPGSWTEIFRAVRDAEVVHLSGNWTLINALVYWSAQTLKKPYLFCPAGALPIFGRSSTLKRLYRACISRPLVRNAKKMVAITPAEMPVFLQEGATAERIVCIPNAIDPDDYPTPESHSRPVRPFLLFLGRLDLIKGPDLGLEAFIQIATRYPDFDWVFAGPDGGMQASLEARATQAGIRNRVQFAGLVRGAEKSKLLNYAELLVIPSRSEAMSIVALEAGICGTPVVLTDQCGFDEIEKIGGGKVVPVDAAQIAQALDQLLSQRETLGEMGQNLQKFCRERFTWNVRAREYLEQIRQAVSRSTGP